MYRKMKAQIEAEQELSGTLQLETMDSLRTLPVVDMVVTQTTEIYDKVKGSCGVANWTLSSGEAVVNKVMEGAAPLTKCMEKPIHMVDQTLVRGIASLKEHVPMVCEEPSEIYAHAKNQMSAAIGYGADTASSIKTYGWNKANDVLNTKWGNIALNGFGMTANLAEKYIDHYLPESNGELLQVQGVDGSIGSVVPIDQGDKVSVTLDTVGRLSSKVQHRLHQALACHFQTLKQHSEQSIASLSNIKQIMSNSVEPMTAKMSDLWKELSTEEEGEVQEEEQRALLVARRLAQRVATFCTSLPKRVHTMLPVALAEQMDQAAAYATSLYESLKNGSVTDSVKSNVTEQVTKVQNSLHDLNAYSQQLVDAFIAKNKHLAEIGESEILSTE